MALTLSKNLHLEPSDAINLNHGRIGIKSFLTSANVSASSSKADFPITNLGNSFTAERWKPNVLNANTWVKMTLPQQRSINYCGIAAHTLGTSNCGAILQASFDNIDFFNIAEINPNTNASIMFNFPTISAAYWRVFIVDNGGGVIPSIGGLNFGLAMIFERGIFAGHTPVNFSLKTKTLRNVTEGGQYVGASIISQGINGSISLKNITSKFMREQFRPFIILARTKPYFFAWRPFEYPLEVAFGWTNSDIRPTNMGVRDLMSVDFNYDGYNDE